jgi:hypothetical protein
VRTNMHMSVCVCVCARVHVHMRACMKESENAQVNVLCIFMAVDTHHSIKYTQILLLLLKF